ncbi:S8 family peptidase, partial [Anaerosporobacter sp.]|uniref:S8 family peptidase n=1 Tax=Anaerosporobacter sp. TaxID=1872529 RepID=UPI00286FA3FB
QRKDFICDTNDDMFVLFEDLSGHGTSVAGIIAAKDNNEGITGINPNVQLYSARVLDVNLSSPISRVVDAIYWAIDEGVNIINISFGTTTNSEILHKAIKDAKDANILVIAAAGNNGIVEYPAAYDEVMAVGSVNSLGEVSDASAQGDTLEIVAPGEQVMSSGAFDGVAIHDGTSMAAHHVTGVASVLWQKDLSCTNDFIRQLINYSANLYGDKNEYGNGLVDLNFALEQYDAFKELYTEIETTETIIPTDELEDNETIIPIFEDVDYVTGTWTQKTHETIVDNTTSSYVLTSTQLKLLKLGAIWQDQDGSKELKPLNSELAGITEYPQFHGYYTKNYLASYIYLTMVANNSGGTTTYSYKSSDMDIFSTFKVKNISYTSISSLISDAKSRKLFIWGMALHQASDIFAHSAYKFDTKSKKYIRIKHTDYFKSPTVDADDINIAPSRYEAAKQVVKNSMAHFFTNTSGTVEDFSLSATYYNATFYLNNMNLYASKIKASNSALNRVDLIYNTTSYTID